MKTIFVAAGTGTGIESIHCFNSEADRAAFTSERGEHLQFALQAPDNADLREIVQLAQAAVASRRDNEKSAQLLASIKASWARRAAVQGLRPGSEKRAKANLEFLIGAMAAAEAMHVSMNPMLAFVVSCGRDLAEV